jgi:hypothetical protein
MLNAVILERQRRYSMIPSITLSSVGGDENEMGSDPPNSTPRATTTATGSSSVVSYCQLETIIDEASDEMVPSLVQRKELGLFDSSVDCCI